MEKKNQVFWPKIKSFVFSYYLIFGLIIIIQLWIIIAYNKKINTLNSNPSIQIDSSEIDCGVTEISEAFKQDYQYFSSKNSQYFYDITCDMTKFKKDNLIYFYSFKEALDNDRLYKDCNL
ncbi:MAG: hypothetical protein GF347_02980 [Candidatus Moranbacteria bacterium]|nr:hypothetical protein [Candidatus Moranbacteria bacterium]